MNKLHKLKNIQLTVMVIISISLIVIVLSGIDSYDNRFDNLETERIQQLVEKYAIQCYATEGAYPPNIDYLEAHYGLIVNHDKYIYEYEPVAENIKPIIQIFVKPNYN